MAYRSNANSPLGYPLPATINSAAFVPIGGTAPPVPVGTIAKFVEDTQGEGEFIFLPGVASLAVGDAVVYDLAPGAQAVTRLVHNAQNNTGRPVAIATAANTATTTWSWYQISGVAIVNVAAGNAAGPVYASATAGVLDDSADAGDQVLNAQFSTAIGTPAANQAYATINRPCMQSQLT